YAITSDQFLIDGTAGVLPRAATVAAAMEVESNAVVNLINQVQGRQIARTMARAMGISDLSFDSQSTNGTDGAYPNGVSALVIDTNQLWLQITNLIADTVYASLNQATDQVYAIWSTTNLALPFAAWQVELEVFPTNSTTNCLPFTISMEDRPNLFLRAQDWTGVDSDGDGIPDWWIYYWFGNLNKTAADLDSQGNTLLADYQNYTNGTTIDPNSLNFSEIETANTYVNSRSVPLQLDVVGLPYYIAILIDDTNLADAVWETYTASNIVINPGENEGWHGVWVGLRSHADTPSQASWQWKRLKLDFTSPGIFITSLTNNTVTVPLLQLNGYSPEALDSISYDLSNALISVTNQAVLIQDQHYDPATSELTTNGFQAYDILLTNGLNVFTIHATDLAGNITTLVTNVWFQPTTNPPVVQFVWPQNGMKVCGSNITLNGWVSDPMAAITVQSATEATNISTGRVGRDGQFYVADLLLNSGTNIFMLIATDGAGTTETNLVIIQGNVGLAIDPITANQAGVTGEINSNNYTILVNGMTAIISASANSNGVYTWEADNVSMPPRSCVVQVTATAQAAISDEDTNTTALDSQSAAAEVNISGIFASAYNNNYDYRTDGGFWTITDDYSWADGTGGALNYNNIEYIDQQILESWTNSTWPQSVPSGPAEVIFNGYSLGTSLVDLIGVVDYCHVTILPTGATFHQDEQAEFKLATGGPAGSKTNRLWMVSANVSKKTFNDEWDSQWELPVSSIAASQVPYDQVTVGVFGKLDELGNAFKMLPDNDPDDVTVRVNGLDHYGPVVPSASVVELLSLTVVSNAPYAMIGQTNCVAVKTATNDWIYLQATLSSSDTNAANFIQWSGGEAVPGNPFQHRVSKTASVKTTVTATLGSTGLSVNIWILWSTINYQFSGTNPTPLSFQQFGQFPDQTLGVELFSGAFYGKMSAVATITPSGVQEVVSNGWNFFQSRSTYFFQNGQVLAGSIYPAYWAIDATPSTQTLDSNGKLYLIDAPSLPALNGATSDECYENFHNAILWNNIMCSGTNYFWHWDARQGTSVDSTNLGPGMVLISTNSFYQ
ncbi:MAG: hypothetical protein P4M10_05870, partial [Verrucomicrobiae bacterium]|nr:hypothetical protein [Verrucomicrobiae bacterium]